MARKIAPSQINARVAARALKEAEKRLEQPPGDGKSPVFVDVRPKDIVTMPELFQPRRFSAGLRDVDPRHVKNLQTRITRKGELDPVLVVKLKGPVRSQWVCVDGHHRIEAYKRDMWKGTIRCEWFAGTIREAMDESLKRNEVAKLEIAQADKYEEAWRRTLNGWGSKSEVVKLTGTSEGLVAMMRRVVNADRDQTPKGQALRAELGSHLDELSWSRVRAAWVGLTPGEWSIEEEAAKLARILSKRLTDKLKDPAITAKALWIYDPDLCLALARELENEGKERREREQNEQDAADYEALNETHRAK
jgi:uncharacterized ParB-like nuclease family protein